MRFRTGGVLAVAMLAAIAAMPAAAAAQQNVVAVETVPAVNTVMVKTVAQVAPAYAFTITAKNLQPSDTVRLVGQPGAGGILQLRSHGPTKAQVRMSWQVQRPSPMLRDSTASPMRSERTTATVSTAAVLRHRTPAPVRTDSARTRDVPTASRPPARLQT